MYCLIGNRTTIKEINATQTDINSILITWEIESNTNYTILLSIQDQNDTILTTQLSSNDRSYSHTIKNVNNCIQYNITISSNGRSCSDSKSLTMFLEGWFVGGLQWNLALFQPC